MVRLTHWPLGQRPSQGVCCFFNQPLSSQRQTPRWHCRTTVSRVWILSYHTCPGRIKKEIRLKYQGLHGMGPGFEPVLFGSWIRKDFVFRQAVFTSTQRDPVNSKIGWSSSSKSRGSPNPSMRQKRWTSHHTLRLLCILWRSRLHAHCWGRRAEYPTSHQFLAKVAKLTICHFLWSKYPICH